MLYGAFPEPIPRTPNSWFPIQYGVYTGFSYHLENTPWRHIRLKINSVKWQRAIYKQLNSLNTKKQIQKFKFNMQLTRMNWKMSATRKLRNVAGLSWVLEANSDFGSSKRTSLPLGKTIDSSSNSNNRLGRAAGAGVTLLLRFPLRRLRRGFVVLLQGRSGAGTDSRNYSTCLTSTTIFFRATVRHDVSPTSDDSLHRTSNHLSGVTREFLRRKTTAFLALFRSTKIAPYDQAAHSLRVRRKNCHKQ